MPITVTDWKSAEVPVAFEVIRCRSAPDVSSTMYSWPFDIRANVDVVGVTLQAVYFSRTVAHCAPAPMASPERLRSPVAAAPDPALPLYVVTEEDPLAPPPVALAVERASAGGVVPACAVAWPSWLLLAPVVLAVVFPVAAVPPLFVVVERDPDVPAPLAVAEAEPPMPVDADTESVLERVASADCEEPMAAD